MVEFIILKVFWIQLQIVSVRENVLLIQRKEIITASLLSAHCKPYCCCVAAALWLSGGAAATADVGCCAQECREDYAWARGM